MMPQRHDEQRFVNASLEIIPLPGSTEARNASASASLIGSPRVVISVFSSTLLMAPLPPSKNPKASLARASVIGSSCSV